MLDMAVHVGNSVCCLCYWVRCVGVSLRLLLELVSSFLLSSQCVAPWFVAQALVVFHPLFQLLDIVHAFVVIAGDVWSLLVAPHLITFCT